MLSDSIPAELLLKIFDRLPFKDRVRLRGVNRLFSQVSEKSINTMRSLVINDDLMTYIAYSQTLSSLLESCAPMLESIVVNSRFFAKSKWMQSDLPEFVYPKLKHLEITLTSDDLAKKMISRNRNLRSVILHLIRGFEWPEDVRLHELEILEIHSRNDHRGDVKLSSTIRPLIGNVPNLKHLSITMESEKALFILSVQELNLLLLHSPFLETLNLRSSRRFKNPANGPFSSMCQNLVAALPTWVLPNLKRLTIDWYDKNHPFPSSITAFPMLESISSKMITKIDDQGIVALSQLGILRELRLPHLEMSNEKFTEMIESLLPISIMQICGKTVGGGSLSLLSNLDLRELYLSCRDMSEDEIIDLITNVPSMIILGIRKIRDISSCDNLIEFLTTTRHVFKRNLTIRLADMSVDACLSELIELKAITRDMKDTGGSIVEVMGDRVLSIRYVKSSDG